MPGADTKIMTFVKEAADRFSMLAASVEELSVPMHFDGEVFVPICSVFFSVFFVFACTFICKRRNCFPLYSPTGIRICDAICLEGGYRLLHGELSNCITLFDFDV